MKNISKNSYVILIPSLSRGGAEAMAYQYGKYLSEKGHSVQYLLIEDRVDDKYKHTERILVKSTSILASIINLSKVRFDKEVVFISLIPFYTVAFIFSRLLCFEFKSKIIYTVHNNIDFDFGNGKVSVIVKLFYKWILNKSNNVYAVSEEMVNQLASQGVNSLALINKTEHRYVAVNRNVGNCLNFLMVGRLGYQKDYIKAIYFYSCLKKLGISFSVDIYGEGPDKSIILNEIVKNGLEENVTIYDYNEDIEKVMLSEKYDILFLSSRYEGFGLVLIEAISKCIYVLSRDCNYGPREIITSDVGSLIPYDFNQDDVESAIKSFFNKKNQAQSISTQSFESRYNYLQKKSIKTWKKMELYL